MNKIKIKSINHNCRRADVYDVETPTHDYILAGGIISHNTLELYSKDVVGGGTGSYYSADNIYIIGRQQEKEGNDIAGYHFIIKVEKSRYVREGTKIPVTVTFKDGISKWSGILDLATEAGMVQKVRKRSYVYNMIDLETGEIGDVDFSEAETQTARFMEPIVNSKKFREFIEKKYVISHGDIMKPENEEEETLEATTDE